MSKATDAKVIEAAERHQANRILSFNGRIYIDHGSGFWWEKAYGEIRQGTIMYVNLEIVFRNSEEKLINGLGVGIVYKEA